MFPICQKFQGLSVQLPNGQQGSCDDFMTQTKEESQTKNYPEWKIERDMIDHVIIDSKQVCQTAQIMLGHTPHDCTSRDISVCGGKTTENYLGCVARAGENAEAILSVGPNMKILYADDQRSMSGIHMGVQVPGLLYHDKYRVINVGIAAAGGGFDVSNSDGWSEKHTFYALAGPTVSVVLLRGRYFGISASNQSLIGGGKFFIATNETSLNLKFMQFVSLGGGLALGCVSEECGVGWAFSISAGLPGTRTEQ